MDRIWGELKVFATPISPLPARRLNAPNSRLLHKSLYCTWLQNIFPNGSSANQEGQTVTTCALSVLSTVDRTLSKYTPSRRRTRASRPTIRICSSPLSPTAPRKPHSKKQPYSPRRSAALPIVGLAEELAAELIPGTRPAQNRTEKDWESGPIMRYPRSYTPGDSSKKLATINCTALQPPISYLRPILLPADFKSLQASTTLSAIFARAFLSQARGS